MICDFPLKEMLAFHKAKGAEGTILVTQARTQTAHARYQGFNDITSKSQAILTTEGTL